MATDVIPHSSNPSSLGAGSTAAPLDSAAQLGTVSVPQTTVLQGETNYKNLLQEFTQKLAIPLPVYTTINYGRSHPPIFKSTVLVDELVFVSPKAFTRAKAAEQDIAKYAFEALSQKILEEALPMLDLVSLFCKSILNEFAVKTSIPMPTYSTKQIEDGKDPVFTSNVSFGEQTYTHLGRNKKEAEQQAARVVIETILDGTCSKKRRNKKTTEESQTKKSRPEQALRTASA